MKDPALGCQPVACLQDRGTMFSGPSICSASCKIRRPLAFHLADMSCFFMFLLRPQRSHRTPRPWLRMLPSTIVSLTYACPMGQRCKQTKSFRTSSPCSILCGALAFLCMLTKEMLQKKLVTLITYNTCGTWSFLAWPELYRRYPKLLFEQAHEGTCREGRRPGGRMLAAPLAHRQTDRVT